MDCEGYRRYGGAFSFGPVKWVQCTNEAVVILKIEQDNKVSDFPACTTCWKEGIENTKISILNAKPI